MPDVTEPTPTVEEPTCCGVELTAGIVARAIIEKYYPKLYGQKYFVYQMENKLGFSFENNKSKISKSGFVELDKKKLLQFIWKASWKLKKEKKAEKPVEIKRPFVNDVLYYIEQEGLIVESDINGDLLYVNNGILDTKSHELVDSTSDIFVPLRIPVTFNKKIEVPKNIDFFYNDIIRPKDDLGGYVGRKEDYSDDVLTLYEGSGFLLEAGYPIHKAMLLTGEGHNGKDTYLNLNIDFVGSKNHSAISLYDLQDRFSTIELHNIMYNSRGDLGYHTLNRHAMGQIKDLTGGSKEIMARHIRQDHYVKFFSRAKIYYAMNKLPSIFLDDRAFIERWVIETLPNIYPDDDDFPIKLRQPDELSGLLNQALEGKNRLKLQKKFTKSKTQGYSELFDLFEEAKIYDVRRIDEDKEKLDDLDEIP